MGVEPPEPSPGEFPRYLKRDNAELHSKKTLFTANSVTFRHLEKKTLNLLPQH